MATPPDRRREAAGEDDPSSGSDLGEAPATAGVAMREVVRVRAGGRPGGRKEVGPPLPDGVAAEEPLELRLGGRPLAVIMRTPGEDEALAMGFLVSEGVVERPGDVQAMGPARDPAGALVPNTLDVTLAPGLTVDLASLERSLYATSSCGVCGKASIEGVLRRIDPLPDGPPLEAAGLLALPDAMRAAQRGFARTGGLHAAALFDAGGALLALAEDVGRHNAVDKVIGLALARRSPGPTTAPASASASAVLLVSGRASFEVIQKALFARIPVVAAIGAPTSLAVDAARDGNQTLVGFLRDGGFNIYAGAARFGLDAGTPADTDPTL